jgi:hypothetical protein
VICATGYRPDLDRLVGHLVELDPSGMPPFTGAMPSPQHPGLWFFGLDRSIYGNMHVRRRRARQLGRQIAKLTRPVTPAHGERVSFPAAPASSPVPGTPDWDVKTTSRSLVPYLAVAFLYRRARAAIPCPVRSAGCGAACPAAFFLPFDTGVGETDWTLAALQNAAASLTGPGTWLLVGTAPAGTGVLLSCRRT